MPEKELGGGRTAPFFLVRSFKVRHYRINDKGLDGVGYGSRVAPLV